MKIRSVFRITLFILGAILLLTSINLLAQKKIHLGIILPFIIGLGLCIHALYLNKILNFINQPNPKNKILKKLWRLSWSIFLIWCLSLALFFSYLKINNQSKAVPTDVKAILVLGSGLINNAPSPTLAARLDTAAILAQQHPKAYVVVTGGLGYVETVTEADAMAKYLHEQHQIDLARILTEDQSTSTELNLKNSQSILKQHNISVTSPITLVTSDFHTLRAAAIAKKQGYADITTIGAKTPLLTRYNAWLREYFAYISGWLLGEY